MNEIPTTMEDGDITWYMDERDIFYIDEMHSIYLR